MSMHQLMEHMNGPMKLYTTPRAPNPRRVAMFMAEKGISGIGHITIGEGMEQLQSCRERIAARPSAPAG